MSDEERVKAKWPDAEISAAFVLQPDQSKCWMWCVMSPSKYHASRGNKNRVLNVGWWRFSEAEAWADAAGTIEGNHW